MSINKQITLDQVTVEKNGVLQCRETVVIIEDGVELAKTYHRFTLQPGQDLTGQHDRVAAVAQAAWTPEVIAAFNG
jgi:hypothetical protein